MVSYIQEVRGRGHTMINQRPFISGEQGKDYAKPAENRPFRSAPKWCARCSKPLHLLDRFTYDAATKRCKRCQQEVQSLLETFKSQFLFATSDNYLSFEEWQRLLNHCQFAGIGIAEACGYIRQEACEFIKRLVAVARANGAISERERQDIEALESLLMLDDAGVRRINEEVQRLVLLTDIRSGRLPTIQPNIALQAGEIAHYEDGRPILYVKKTATRTTNVEGRIIITNKRMLFIAPSGGTEIPLGEIVTVEEALYEDHKVGFALELSRKSGNGI